MESKKKVLVISFAIFVLFGIYNVSAGLGITPGITRINFQPNMSFLVSFNALDASPDQMLKIYADGDLSEYVKFDKDSVVGQQPFTAYVDLPNFINKTGKNRLIIRILEINNDTVGIGARLEVGALIEIMVPYPGKYAEIKSFNVPNVNEGEPVHFSLELNNLGSEDLTPGISVDVYSQGKLTETINFPTKTSLQNSIETFGYFSKKKYKPGLYEAYLSVNLKDENKTILKANSTFYVGGLSLSILKWTKEVNIGKLNSFNIEIESKWNNDIKNVYAEVNVTKNGVGFDFFKTPSIELKKWEKANLSGYLNAESLEEGSYKANIIVYYEDKTTSKIVDIRVINPESPKSNLTMIITIAIIVSVILIVFFAFYIILIKKIETLKVSENENLKRLEYFMNKNSNGKRNRTRTRDRKKK